MDDERATTGRTRRRAKPLDRTRLEELAVAYVARFATSAGKLKAYLQRKLRERGWAGAGRQDPGEVAVRGAAQAARVASASCGVVAASSSARAASIARW